MTTVPALFTLRVLGRSEEHLPMFCVAGCGLEGCCISQLVRGQAVVQADLAVAQDFRVCLRQRSDFGSQTLQQMGTLHAGNPAVQENLQVKQHVCRTTHCTSLVALLHGEKPVASFLRLYKSDSYTRHFSLFWRNRACRNLHCGG